MGWRGPATDKQIRVWLAWKRIHDTGDRDLSMDGCVPVEVQRRWEGKVGGAQAALHRGLLRSKQARDIAQRTGRDESEVYDELKKLEESKGLAA
jgi:hypothetical protein